MPKVKDCYIERDVSWMYFNHRILEEAEKEYIPLLERVSFLGIYSNNLDEFFRVRVASLNRLSENRHIDKQTLEKIRCSLKTINKLNATYAAEYTMAIDRVESELRLHGIRLLKENELNEEQQHFLTELFYNKLNGSINPIWLSEIKDLAVFEDNRIYLAVEKTEVESQKKKYAIVKVPDRAIGRWVRLPKSDGYDNIMYLDDVVRFCLPLVFIGFKESTFRAYSFKFTKDAEMDLDNYADYGTLEKIAAGVNSRRRGSAVRVIYDGSMPKGILKQIRK